MSKPTTEAEKTYVLRSYEVRLQRLLDARGAFLGATGGASASRASRNSFKRALLAWAACVSALMMFIAEPFSARSD